MATITSSSTSLQVLSTGLPSWVPAVNTVAAISGSVLNDVNPGAGPWDTGSGFAPMVHAWNSGCFASDYSTFGALVVAGGGDNDWFGNDYYAYDLSLPTPSWARLHNPTSRCSSPSTRDTVHGEWDDGQAGVGHTYGAFCYLPAAMGGGPKGSLIHPINTYWYLQTGSNYAHRGDLATGVWSRCSTNGCAITHESCWTFDSTRNRFIGFETSPSGPPTGQMLLLSNFVNGTGTHTSVASNQFTFGGDASCEYYPDGDALITYGRDENPGFQFGMRAWDIAAGFVKYDLTFTGDSLPVILGGAGMAWCPDNKSFYLRNPAQGQEQNLWKITPPTSTNWRTTAWTVTKIVMAGATVAPATAFGVNGMWQRLRYVPAIKCLVWVSSISTAVYAYRISTLTLSMTWQKIPTQDVYSGLFNTTCKHLTWGLVGGRWYKMGGDHTQWDPISPNIQGGRQEIFSVNISTNNWSYDQRYFVRSVADPPSAAGTDQAFQMDDPWCATRGNEIHVFNSVNNPTPPGGTTEATNTARANYGSDIATQWVLTQMAWNPSTKQWRVVNAAGTPSIMHGDRSFFGFYDPLTDRFWSNVDLNGENWVCIDGATGADLTQYSGGIALHYSNPDHDFHIGGIAADLPNRKMYLIDMTDVSGQTQPGLFVRDIPAAGAYPSFNGCTRLLSLDFPFESAQTTSKLVWHPVIRSVCFFCNSDARLHVVNVDTLHYDIFDRHDVYLSANGQNWVRAGCQNYDPVTNCIWSIQGYDIFAANSQIAENSAGGYWRINLS